MASCKELKELTRSRLQSARTLMNAQDWEAAAYMMGYVLETLLKSASCKALHLEQYPDDRSKHQEKVLSFFMTHNFDQLLYISGLSDVFNSSFFSWAQFTTSYLGDWPRMRYDVKVLKQFDEIKVNQLYDYLYKADDSIIKTVQKMRRW